MGSVDYDALEWEGCFAKCTGGIRECCADVVDGIAVGPVAGFLVDEHRVE